MHHKRLDRVILIAENYRTFCIHIYNLRARNSRTILETNKDERLRKQAKYWNKVRRLLIGDTLVDQIVISIAILGYVAFRLSLHILGREKRSEILDNRHISIRTFLIKDFVAKIEGLRFYVRKNYEDYFVALSLEDRIIEFAKTLLNAGDVFVDVGCHIGKYSVIIANHVGTQGKVYAIDANPENIAVLKKNIALNRLTNITIINKAVSDKEGITKFYLRPSSGMGSLSATEGPKSITVNVNTLYNELKEVDKIDLMKIDVEGEEVNVINGAGLLLERTRNLIIECHSPSYRDSIESILHDKFSIKLLASHENKRFWLFCERT